MELYYCKYAWCAQSDSLQESMVTKRLDLQIGACYLHPGYKNIRGLLKDFDLQHEEVGFAEEYLAVHSNAEYRKVWDVRSGNDYSRGEFKGQGFEDFILSEAYKV
jgi:hypothetical protein